MEIGQKPLFHHVLVFRVAVVGEGFDRDTTTRVEQPDDLKVFGIHQFHQILHDDVDAILVEVTMVAEAEEIEFEALALHHQRTGNVINNKVAKIGLARLGAEGGELRTIQGNNILVFRMFILKDLEYLWRIVIVVLRVLVAQQRHTLQFLFASRHNSNFGAKLANCLQQTID